MNTPKQVEPTKHFFEYFNENIPKNWDEPALTDYDDVTSYTYGEMGAKMIQVQAMLEVAGLKAGDKIAICSKNCANWAISFLAIAANRGVVVSIMDAFVESDIENLVTHSDAKAIFVGPAVWKRLHPDKMPNIQIAIGTEQFRVLYTKDERLNTVKEDAERLYSERYPYGFTKDDVNLPTDNLDELMIINYTSGTTSAPKGVMLSYRAISANVQYSQETIPNHAAGPLICYEHWYNEMIGCCGSCVTRNELKIDSPDPENVVGEILFRGEHVMMGYYKNEKATRDAIDEEGWLHTGDLGTLNKKGLLFIKGRSKAMILSSNGQNIYPEEIEDKVNNLPGVVESLVVGRQGKIVALVYPDEKYDLQNKSMDELMSENLAKLNEMLPAYSKVSSIVLVDKEFEKTPKRSIRRFLYS